MWGTPKAEKSRPEAPGILGTLFLKDATIRHNLLVASPRQTGTLAPDLGHTRGNRAPYRHVRHGQITRASHRSDNTHTIRYGHT